MHEHDVVVVGTGVLGMAIAVWAADAGLHVTLVGPGYGTRGAASPAAGAMLGVLGEHTIAEQDPADLVFRHESALLWPSWIEAIAEHARTRVPLGQGTVVIANLDHPADRDNLEAIRRAAGVLGVPVEDLDPRQVPGLRPAPRHAPVAALVCPRESWVDAQALLTALDTACHDHPGVDRVPGTARSILVSADTPAVTGVALDDDTRVICDRVVLAAGAASGALLAPLASLTGPLPAVLAAKGVSLVMDVSQSAQPPMVIRTPNRDFACGLHVVPRGPGGLYVGATNRFITTAPATGPTAGEQLSLLHGLLHQFRVDLRTTTLSGTYWGHRPASADGAPLIGACNLPGLMLATGTYRNGVLMAPAIAAIITAGLLDKPEPMFNPYRPTPRARVRPDLRRLRATGAVHMTSVLLDPDGALPFDRERQLGTTLASLLDLALSDDQDVDLHREQLRALLIAHPTVEGVCRIFDIWETRT